MDVGVISAVLRRLNCRGAVAPGHSALAALRWVGLDHPVVERCLSLERPVLASGDAGTLARGVDHLAKLVLVASTGLRSVWVVASRSVLPNPRLQPEQLPVP